MKLPALLALISITLLLSACIQAQTEGSSEIKSDTHVPEVRQANQSNIKITSDTLINESFLKREVVPQDSGINDDFSYVSKPHWTHMPVTYKILNEEECGRYETTRIRRAFSDLTNATNGVVYFAQLNDSVDIELTCIFIEDCYKRSVEISSDYVIRYETICEHELGLTRTTAEENEIRKAEIYLYGLSGFAETKREGPSGFYVGTCGHADTEIHELLHAFGYKHSEDNSSIMYYKSDTFGLSIRKVGECQGSKGEIDKSIVDDLIKTYVIR